MSRIVHRATPGLRRPRYSPVEARQIRRRFGAALGVADPFSGRLYIGRHQVINTAKLPREARLDEMLRLATWVEAIVEAREREDAEKRMDCSCVRASTTWCRR